MTLDKIYHAAFVLKDIIRKTDVIAAPELNPDADIILKTENLQVTGSFKVRGAAYKISQLSDEEKARGVIACSAGNHAQGVALAATKAGAKSLICLPDNAPISKIEATKKYGADVCLVPGVYDDAYNKALELRDSEGYTFVHPFNDEDVIAGQGTIGLEILEQVPDVDAVIVPVGGGGLISGSMVKSVKEGKIKKLASVTTIADGIAVKEPGDLTFDLVSQYVDELVTVTDDEVAAAILALIEQQKLCAEGAGAVSVAAAMFNKVPVAGKKVVCLVSGGNIDVTILSRVIDRGLLKSGRTLSIQVNLVDKPGQLQGVANCIADAGGNVTYINHEKATEDMSITDAYLRITMETKNFEHIDSILTALSDAGFTYQQF